MGKAKAAPGGYGMQINAEFRAGAPLKKGGPHGTALPQPPKSAERYRVISNTSNSSLPAGTVISATSPTDLPSRPLPMGDFTEILPVARLASS